MRARRRDGRRQHTQQDDGRTEATTETPRGGVGEEQTLRKKQEQRNTILKATGGITSKRNKHSSRFK